MIFYEFEFIFYELSTYTNPKEQNKAYYETGKNIQIDE